MEPEGFKFNKKTFFPDISRKKLREIFTNDFNFRKASYQPVSVYLESANESITYLLLETVARSIQSITEVYLTFNSCQFDRHFFNLLEDDAWNTKLVHVCFNKSCRIHLDENEDIENTIASYFRGVTCLSLQFEYGYFEIGIDGVKPREKTTTTTTTIDHQPGSKGRYVPFFEIEKPVENDDHMVISNSP